MRRDRLLLDAKVTGYIVGADRNNPDTVRAHLYATTQDGEYWPMCEYGWNRSDGERLSILRGNGSARGTCKLCEKRRDAKLLPIFQAKGHKTKWL